MVGAQAAAFRTTPHLGPGSVSASSTQGLAFTSSTARGPLAVDPPDPNGLHLPKLERTPAYAVAGRWWPTLVVPGPGVAHLLSSGLADASAVKGYVNDAPFAGLGVTGVAGSTEYVSREGVVSSPWVCWPAALLYGQLYSDFHALTFSLRFRWCSSLRLRYCGWLIR